MTPCTPKVSFDPTQTLIAELLYSRSEEHRKRVMKSGKRCAFFEMLEGSSNPAPAPRAGKSNSRSTSQSVPKKKVVVEDDTAQDDPSSDELSELTVLTTAKSKRTTRASSVPSKTPGSRKSARSTGTSGRGKGTAASEVEEDPEASGSEIGKRVSKSKKKSVKKLKEKIEVIEEEDEANDIEVVEEEPVVQKPKRGRPPGKAKAAKAKKTPDSAPDHSEVEPPPTKPAKARMRAKPNIESDSEPSPPIKPPSSQPKLKSSTKSKKADDLPESDGSRKKRATKDEHTDAELMPPPKTKAKAKPSVVVTTKAIEIEADEEDDEAPMPPVPEPKKTVKEQSRPLEEKQSSSGASRVDAPVSQAKGRKSSSTSDDAGYATAEQPMEVDDDHSREDSGPRNVLPLPRRKSADKPPSSHRVSGVSGLTHGDVDMQDVNELPRDSKAAQPLGRPLATRPTSKPAPKEPARPLVRAPSRTTGSLARPPSRIGTEIVDISSDDDDDELDVLQAIVREKPSSSSSVGSGTIPPSSSRVSLPPSSSRISLSSVAAPTTSKPSPPSHQPTTQKVTPSPPVALATADVARNSSTAPRVAARTPSPDVVMEQAVEDISSDAHRKPPSMSRPKEVEVAMTASAHTPLPETSSIPPPVPALLPSFDEDIAAEDAHNADPTLDTFIPFLATVPVDKLTALTEEEANLTLEQYIRRQLEHQYQQLTEDGGRQIAQFKQRAAETRRRIEEL